jgi:FkbM family methyltransferase
VKDWLTNGHEERRYRYNFKNCNNIFFDLGSMHGIWSKRMLDTHGGVSHLFEVVPEFNNIINTKYGEDNRYIITNKGLAHETYTANLPVGSASDGTTLTDTSTNNYIPVDMISVHDYLKQKDITTVDVLKINIEGGEYELLEFILDNNLQNIFKNIQVQFHYQYKVPDFYNRWLKIRDRLSNTHNKTYDYYFVWENWAIK